MAFFMGTGESFALDLLSSSIKYSSYNLLWVFKCFLRFVPWFPLDKKNYPTS